MPESYFWFVLRRMLAHVASLRCSQEDEKSNREISSLEIMTMNELCTCWWDADTLGHNPPFIITSSLCEGLVSQLGTVYVLQQCMNLEVWQLMNCISSDMHKCVCACVCGCVYCSICPTCKMNLVLQIWACFVKHSPKNTILHYTNNITSFTALVLRIFLAFRSRQLKKKILQKEMDLTHPVRIFHFVSLSTQYYHYC